MHHLRLALIAAALCGVSYGCATPDEPAAKATAAAAPAEAAPVRNGGSYRTGSRLPSYDSDGSSSTGSVSKDDFNDQMNRSMSGRQPGMAP